MPVIPRFASRTVDSGFDATPKSTGWRFVF